MSEPWDLTPAQRMQFREAQAEAKRKQMVADFAADITARARWARDHNDGFPKAAWSTGEKFAVALVLDKIVAIAEMGYSRADALERLAGDIAGTEADAEAWIKEVQGRL